MVELPMGQAPPGGTGQAGLRNGTVSRQPHAAPATHLVRRSTLPAATDATCDATPSEPMERRTFDRLTCNWFFFHPVSIKVVLLF